MADTPDPPVRRLLPAQHVEQPPDGGWLGADLDDDELVDDRFIAADPDSYLITPEVTGDGS